MASKSKTRTRGMNAALASGEAGVGELAPARSPLRPRQAVVLILAAAVGGVAGVVTFHSAVLTPTTFSGQVVPAHAYYLNFTDTGPVLTLDVQPGAQVKAGQVLATESNAVAQADLAAAQAAVTADQAAVAADQNPADEPRDQSPAALQQAQSQLAAARAEVVTDQQAVADASLVAPATGYVADTGGAIGDVDSPQGVRSFDGPAGQSGANQDEQPGFQLFAPDSDTDGQSSADTNSGYNALITLYTDPQRVVAQVPEADIQTIRQGQGATMSIGAAGLIASGTVSEILLDPADVPGVVDYDVVISMESVPAQVLAGMSVTVTMN